MTIKVKYDEKPVICKFTKDGDDLRMYMQTNDYWFPAVGWCPHLNLGGGECRDCSLALDDD